MINLSKYEKETILLTSEGDQTYSIYTFNKKMKKKLAEFSSAYPDLCRKVRETDEGSVTYEIEKTRVSIRLIPPYSEKRRKAASEYAKVNGLNGKMINNH